MILNSRLVAADDCTKQPLFKVQLPLEPGKNVLSFICRIPEGFENRGATFVYRYFELTHIQPSGPVRAIFPSSWQKWQEKGDHIDFQSEKNTQIILFNNENRVSEVSLSFVLNILFKFATVTRRLYQEEIVYMDSQLQELINFLQTNQMIDESLFVIIGDHGEGLGEVNNHFGHIHHLNSLYCHVPLVIFGRGIDKGKVNSQVVSTLEVAPTILKAIHTPVPESMRGHSLTEPFVSSELVLETYSPEAFYDCFSIVDFPHQIVYFPQRDGHKIEFYNLEKDALAVNNLYLDSSVERTKKKLLAKIIKISQTMLKMKGKISAYSKEMMQMLKTLGYL